MRNTDKLIFANIEKNGLIPSDCTGIVLAVSGGSDSMTLLDFFIRAGFSVPFSVAHINHGLREESSDEERFLVEYCKTKGVIIDVYHADIPNTKPSGVSVEEFARSVRYSFFESIRKKYGFSHIATAHNKNDATESFFMNIVRGSGIHGVAGLPVSREDKVIRPLLLCEKQDIVSNCEENGIPYVTDMTNFESICTRNIIRNEILPKLREINPRLDDAVARLSVLANDDEDYFNKKIHEALLSFGENRQKNELPLNFLKSNEKSVVSRLLRCVFSDLPDAPVLTFSQTNDIIHLINSGKTSDRILLSNGYFAVIGYETLRFVKQEPISEIAEPLPIAEGENICGKFSVIIERTVAEKSNIASCFCADLPLFVRSRKASDKVRLFNRPEKSVRQLFIDQKIPSEKRGDMLLVTDSSNVPVWLRGFGASGEFIPTLNEPAWQITIKEITNPIGDIL
jgi:tRNA(Ile)-lysidine synthase